MYALFLGSIAKKLIPSPGLKLNLTATEIANDYEKMVLIIIDDVSEISFPINMSFSSVKK